MQAERSWAVAVLLLAGLAMGGASAPALAQGHFGLSAGLYQLEDDEADRTEVFGARGGYRFSPRLGFEVGLSRLDLADAFSIDDEPSFPGFDIDFQVDLYNLDLSLQWFPGGGGLVVFAGPGLARIDSEVNVTVFGQTISESDSVNIFTAHAGLGYEWQVGESFFIRPEARVRRYFDDELSAEDEVEEGVAVSYEATDYEAGLLFGWRFGS